MRKVFSVVAFIATVTVINLVFAVSGLTIAERMVGDRLYHLTKQYDNIKYKFGEKNIKKGAIDCSGWIKFLAEAASKDLGRKLNTGAAWQITESAKIMGGYSNEFTDFMLIGLNYNNCPKWAHGRPYCITHIVVKFKYAGVDWISESASSKGGVTLTRFDVWLEQNSHAKMYKVDLSPLLS